MASNGGRSCLGQHQKVWNWFAPGKVLIQNTIAIFLMQQLDFYSF
jgi:hypothetical protein